MKIIIVLLLVSSLGISQSPSQEDRATSLLYNRVLQMRMYLTFGANDKAWELAEKTNSLAHWVSTPWLIRYFYQTYGSIAENRKMLPEKIAPIYLEGIRVLKTMDRAEINYPQIRDVRTELSNMHTYLGLLYEKEKDTKVAKTYYEEAIELNKESAFAYRSMANMLEKDDLNECVRILDTGGTALINKDKEESAKLYNLAGVKLSNNQRYEESIAYFKKASGVYPDNPIFYANLSYVYGKLKNKTEQENVLINAYSYLKKKDLSKSGSIAFNLSELYYQSFRDDKAIEYSKLAVEDMPDSLSYRVRLADYLYKAKRVSEAITNLHKGYDYFLKKDNKVFAANMINREGLIYFYEGDNKKAVDIIREAVKLNPYQAVYYSNISYIYSKTKEYESALKALEEGIKSVGKTDSTSLSSLYHYTAQVYLDMNDLNLAYNYAEKALKHNKLVGINYLIKGNILEKLGKKDEALEVYKEGEKTLTKNSIDIPIDLLKRIEELSGGKK